ncbi:hypothetical protein SPW_7362 [Streptomyces sp. W007]|uniref:hypothetical protein n=1 Tax=Streptomyces sp. W007 TaxID=1055352 RepID=UPI000241A791|nr:hypothetical protein [Streptomyces sp. W007]EHM24268.1 hypothetical protein SPW_7362 [Streptomyces sp. W007]
MTEYIAQCRAGRHDKITARTDGGTVELAATHYGEHKMETFLSADAARTFARGILALADEVDGGEAKAEPADVAPRMPDIGDRVRVLMDGANSAEVASGDVFTVTSVGRSDFNTDAGWYFRPGDVEILPVSPSAAASTTFTREAYLHRAAELLGATPSASDLIELANYLAGGDA